MINNSIYNEEIPLSSNHEEKNPLYKKHSVDDTESNIYEEDRQCSSQISEGCQQNRQTEQVYCLDIWHCISKHIDPEDIGRFAQICRQTAYVTSTAEFWKHVYRKYITPDHLKHLPSRLHPDNVINQRKGLRANTIRCLFLTYQPFKKRIENLRHLETVRNSSSYSNILHRHPVYQQLQKKDFSGKLVAKTINTDRRKPLQRRSFYNFFQCIPKCYVYTFQARQKKGVEQPKKQNHLHHSEDIFFNEHGDSIILLIKTLSKAKVEGMEKVPDAQNGPSASIIRNQLETLSIWPSRYAAIKHVHTTDIGLVFREGRRRNSIIYTQTTQFGLYNWWDPMYDQVLYNDF